MAPEYDRKLIAVLYADAVGYSRLMGANEDATVQTLKSYRGLISNLIEKHQGYLVDSPGDSLLAAFPSVLAAVRCAVETQEELKARNAELPEDRQMHFRIGVNQGDVIADGDRLYGDGVNVASRVEGLADAGGVCITGSAYEQVRKKLSFRYRDIGKHEVKNIEKPVQVYKVVTEPDAGKSITTGKKPSAWKRTVIAAVAVLVAGVVATGFWFSTREPAPPRLAEVASVENMAYPLPEKPSIAVLPFAYLGGDLERRFLADGFTENVINQLSHHPFLLVTSRTATLTYADAPISIREVSEDLGVRYVLEGSVQVSDDRVRVTAQLIDAVSGYHVLSKQYDRELSNVFSLLDEVSRAVLSAVHVELISHSSESPSFNAWEHYIKAMDMIVSKNSGTLTVQILEEVIELLRESLEADPDYINALHLFGAMHMVGANTGLSANPEESYETAKEVAERILSLDESHEAGNYLLSMIRLYEGEVDDALQLAYAVVSANPNYALGHHLLHICYSVSGNPNSAIASMKRAMRLAVNYPNGWLYDMGTLYAEAHQYTEAKGAFERFMDRYEGVGPFRLMTLLKLASVSVWLDRRDQARGFIDHVREEDPSITMDTLRNDFPYVLWGRKPQDKERYLSALKEAGLK